MKKFVSSLLFAAFLVVSQLPVVHAWDMFAMDGMGAMVHEEAWHSIFCNENPSDKSASDCAKEPLPEKAAITARGTELPHSEAKKTSLSTFVAANSEKRQARRTENRAEPPPWVLASSFDQADYTAHIGTSIRKLD